MLFCDDKDVPIRIGESPDIFYNYGTGLCIQIENCRTRSPPF